MSLITTNTISNGQRPDPKRVRLITEKVRGLPTLPTVVSKMIQIVDNPKTSTATLSNLISTDQALTARILKLANSAYYGFSKEIYTVNMAIVVMGFNAVKEMGLSLSVFDAFKDLTAVGHFEVAEYWEHSIACGAAARVLGRKCRHEMAGEAFVAGLLHDIGKIILNQYMRPEFALIMDAVSNGQSLDDAELDVLGVTHGEVGSWLTEKWHLPVAITQSLRFHHSPWNASQEHRQFVAIVSLADYLTHSCAIGSSGRIGLPILDERTWNIFSETDSFFSVDDLDQLKTEFLMELDKTEVLSDYLRR